MKKLFNAFNWSIIPAQIFLFIFWLKNGFIDKVMGILLYKLSPATAYQGDSWGGWSSYIVGTWDKSQVGHAVLSPAYPYLFPVLIALQCLPVLLMIVAVLRGEFLTAKDKLFTMKAAVASLFVTGCMLFSQTLSGASDGHYLWELLGMGMVLIMYIKNTDK